MAKAGEKAEDSPSTSDETVKERLALEVLLRWKDPRLGGYALVPEYVEERPLWNPAKPGLEQGDVRCC